MISFGSRARTRWSNSMYHSFFKVGCNPPTMWTSVIPRASDSSHRADDIVDRALESVGISLFRRERAELAGENADVRVIDVAIQDVGGDVAVLLLAHRAGHDAQSVQIVRSIEDAARPPPKCAAGSRPFQRWVEGQWE